MDDLLSAGGMNEMCIRYRDRVGSFMGGVDRALEAGLDVSRIVNIEEI